MRQIPASGINLFQLIYVLIREYEASSGKKCLNLSLGNPDLIPVPEILELKARFQTLPDYDLHTYAEDKNLNGFSEGMVEAFSGVRLGEHSHLRATPIAGIKTATAVLPLACGMHLKGREKFHVVTHLPAYDVMGTWSTSYYGANRIVWPLSPSTGMAMELSALTQALKVAHVEKPDFIFVIRPGNPASAGATEKEWKALIEFCIARGTRLVNDGAYTTLTDGSHIPLARVAKNYPALEWMELYSVSKSFSDPGQRLGVAVGSRDFIEDFCLMKGNTDSGPVPVGMMAYGELFKDQKRTKNILNDLYSVYRARLDYLVPKLKTLGLRPACETTSGFFTLWQTPRSAFGIDLVSESRARGVSRAELFNRLVIEKTGIVGVHFQGPAVSPHPSGRLDPTVKSKISNPSTEPEQYIRYAVCTDVLSPEFQKRFDAVITAIQPGY